MLSSLSNLKPYWVLGIVAIALVSILLDACLQMFMLGEDEVEGWATYLYTHEVGINSTVKSVVRAKIQQVRESGTVAVA